VRGAIREIVADTEGALRGPGCSGGPTTGTAGTARLPTEAKAPMHSLKVKKQKKRSRGK
jgi:hypothetical protein